MKESTQTEMLTVSRKEVQEIYTQNQNEIIRENVSSSDRDCYETVNEVLKTLFGSKCLPDEPPLKITAAEDSIAMAKQEMGIEDEPKPAEPKFKVGDYARYKGDVHKVVATTKDNRCYLNKILGSIDESDLEPYTEPTENKIGNPDFSNASKSSPLESDSPYHIVKDSEMVDSIIKDGFREHNRLDIAAMAMQGMLSNTTRFSGYEISDLVRISLNCADALLSEAEKGGLQ